MSPCNPAGARRLTCVRVAFAAFAAALLGALPLGAAADPTKLSSVPLPTYTVGSTTDIKPNIMMVLDDSGSMDWDYLPDWANDTPSNYRVPRPGTGADTWTVDSTYGQPLEPHVPGYVVSYNGNNWTAGVPQYLLYNAAFNGLAYNPAITYTPPVTFNSDGTKNTTTYPSMKGTSAATGADTTQTTPNWLKVPNDGYGVQYPWTFILNSSSHGASDSTSSLVDNRNAYFYTVIPGEYCNSPALTDCKPVSQITQDASNTYLYPAPLRWCKDGTLTTCRGLQMAGSYNIPRFPSPRISVLAVSTVPSTGGSVTGIQVDGLQIMSGTASVTNNSASGLASAIVTKINDCRYAKSGSCTVVGYFAQVSGSDNTKITVYAPGQPAAAPTVAKTPAALTVTMAAFATDKIPLPDAAANSATRSTDIPPGDNLRTVLTSSVTKYYYPGTQKKASSRSDCADPDFCTYTEEMTNYANWWAYYRTRMQMMKSATSRAFSALDTQTDLDNGTSRYRVGYLTINNNTGSDFVNIDLFGPAQKVTWFSQLFTAKPQNSTPLREALSTAGRLYGGKMNNASFRGSTVKDPLQYSCQKNYTILSTDGYWNGNDGFKLDGSTNIGNQDGSLARPYSDGSATKLQKRTSTLQKRAETQKAQKGTLQRQITQLQSQTSQLLQMTSTLQKQTAPLLASTAPVLSSTATLMKSTRDVLQSQASVQSATIPVLQSQATPQATTFAVLQSQAPLLTATLPVYSSTSQLQTAQMRQESSTTFSGGTWINFQPDGGSCTDGAGRKCRQVFLNGAGVYTTTPFWTNVAAGSSCTKTSPKNNNPGQGTWTDCQYTDWTTPAPAPGGTCTWKNQDTSWPSSVTTATQCSYGPAGLTSPAVSGCTWAQQTSTTNGAVYNAGTACSYGAFPPATPAPGNTCTWVNPTTSTNNGTSYAQATQCSYAAAVGPTAAPAGCTVATAQSSTTTGAVWNPARSCSYTAYTTPIPAPGGTCTYANAATSGAGGTVYNMATTCSYGAPGTYTAAAACTWTQQTATTDGAKYNPGTACNYGSYSAPSAAPSNVCTWVNPTTSTAPGTVYAPKATQCSYTAATTPAASACTWQNAQTSQADNASYKQAATCSYSAFTTPAAAAGGTCTWQNPSTATTDGSAWTSTPTKCSYASYGTPTPSACTVAVPATGTTDGSQYKAAVTCSYGAWSTVSTGGSCSASAQTTNTANGTAYNASPVQCTYSDSAWTPVGSCSKLAKSTGPTNFTVGTASDCKYDAWTDWTGAQTCTAKAQSTGPTNYTVGVATACQSVIINPYADALSCGVTTSPDLNGKTTQCKYNFAPLAATQTCLPAVQANDFTNITVYQGCMSDPGTASWLPASTCNLTSPDANGQYTNCSYTNWTGWSDDANCKVTQQDVGPNFTVATATDCQSVTTSTATSDTLADVAAYYYNTDLRSSTATGVDKTGTCQSTVKGADGNWLDLCLDNVPSYGLDVNPKQHMTLHTLGLGATGYLQYSPYQNDLSGVRTYTPDYWKQVTGDFYDVSAGTTASPSSGICAWQTSGSCNWPKPQADSPANIDDLWHAAVNGHGTYFSAGDPSSLTSALTTVLNQITNTPRPGTAAAAASSNPNITSSDNYVFSSSYKSVDWYGELIMQRFNLDGTLTRQQWSAMRLLDCATTPWQAGKSYAVGDVYKTADNGECRLVTQAYKSTGAAYDATTDGGYTAKLTSGPFARTIYTATNNALVSFDYNNLDATQKSYFDKANLLAGSASGGLSQFCSGAGCLSSTQQDSASGQALIDFLKGVRTYETSYYRVRPHILGDIVSSEARYVKAPLQNYTDAGYKDFVSKMGTRAPMVYVGSNDGMLHAFDALTGVEKWAFVPPAVLPTIYHLADANYKDNHRYYVDGTAEVGDVCPKAPGGTCTKDEWKTVLVGGLNQGGRAFYALDITDPANPKFLWEFNTSKSANLGYTYGNPRIGKLGGSSSDAGTWTVMLSSGYNNISAGDGLGHLFVLNAYTGTQIMDIPTTSGSTTTPSGLARIAARAPNGSTNATIEEVYGGDLNGNVWRFDPNGNIGNAGTDAQLLIQLKDPSGNPQPITAKPVLSAVNNKPLVIIGTGRYLGTSDLTNTDVNSLYGIKDDLNGTQMVTPRASGSNFVQQTFTETTCPADAPANTCISGQIVRTSSSLPVDWSSAKGWYLDLVIGGERAVTDSTLALGTLVFTTIKPQSATADQIAGCSAADSAINAKSYLYYLNYLTGGAVDGTKNVVGEELCTCIATRPSVVKTVSGNVEGIIRTSGGIGNAIGSDQAGGTGTGSDTSTGGGQDLPTTGAGDQNLGSTDLGVTLKQDLPVAGNGSAPRRISWRELNGQ